MNDYIDDHTTIINTHKMANENTQGKKIDNKEASTEVSWLVGLIVTATLIAIVFGILILIYFLQIRNKKKRQTKHDANGSKADSKMGNSSKSSNSPNKGGSNSTDTTDLSTMKEPEKEQEPNAQSITKPAKTATSTTKSSETAAKTKSPTIYMETLKTLTSPLTHQSSTQTSKQHSKQEGINGKKRNNGLPRTFLRNTFNAKHTQETSESHYYNK